MDEFTPQTGGLEVREGHEESDLSVRGIIISAIVLAVAGFLSFLLMKGFMVVLAKAEPRLFPQPELTAVQRQLVEEREARPAPGVEERERVARAPDRGDEEARLQRTFPTPRLQYDDERDMEMFRASEEKWLESSGKDAAGNVRVPVADAMKAIVDHGLPAVSGSFVPPTLPTAVPMVPASPRK
jgi:hypothetical protein